MLLTDILIHKTLFGEKNGKLETHKTMQYIFIYYKSRNIILYNILCISIYTICKSISIYIIWKISTNPDPFMNIFCVSTNSVSVSRQLSPEVSQPWVSQPWFGSSHRKLNWLKKSRPCHGHGWILEWFFNDWLACTTQVGEEVLRKVYPTLFWSTQATRNSDQQPVT